MHANRAQNAKGEGVYFGQCPNLGAIVKTSNYLSILLSKEDADVTSCDLGV